MLQRDPGHQLPKHTSHPSSSSSPPLPPQWLALQELTGALDTQDSSLNHLEGHFTKASLRGGASRE